MCYPQAKNMGLDKKMKMYSSSASIESIAPGDLQGAAEGVYFFENFPRMLSAKNDEFHKEFLKRVGIDEENAREVGGTRVMDKSHGWQAWEDIFAIKQAVEASGYKARKDVEGVIQALEGIQLKNSPRTCPCGTTSPKCRSSVRAVAPQGATATAALRSNKLSACVVRGASRQSEKTPQESALAT